MILYRMNEFGSEDGEIFWCVLEGDDGAELKLHFLRREVEKNMDLVNVGMQIHKGELKVEVCEGHPVDHSKAS